jgi:hypothetical protein
MPICCNRCCGSKKPLSSPQEQVDTTIHLKKAVATKATPYGFINIFSGKGDLYIAWHNIVRALTT